MGQENGGTMAKSEKQKQKLLYIAKYLMEHTDETHAVSTPKLIEYLNSHGIKAERKSIYNDIDTLNDFGMDIIRSDAHRGGYMLASREFELAEVKLLIDLVQSSKFITEKKSRELIQKLEAQVSKYDAKAMQRQVQIVGRSKTLNETIYYNVDIIHNALHANKKIKFNYSEWNVKKELQFKKDGAYYVVSPWALTWDDENYYLIAYDESADIIKHFRVDKMQNMRVLEEGRIGEENFRNFDLASFAKKTFAMYGGRDEVVTLLCHNSLAGVIIDRFGQDANMVPVDDDYFYVKALVSVSPQFFGWVTGIGGKMYISGPESVKEEYKRYLEKLVMNYE